MEDVSGPMNMTKNMIYGHLLPSSGLDEHDQLKWLLCLLSLPLPAARGFLSTSLWLSPFTMESSSCLFWLTSVWPPLWTQASFQEVSV